MQIELSDAAYRAISEALTYARAAHSYDVERYTQQGNHSGAKLSAQREREANDAWEMLLAARFPSTLAVR
jgi:hypothetical protein